MSPDQRTPERVTQLLVAWSEGRQEALTDLLPLVYDELRRMAASYLRHEASGHTLQPTALINEAYLRLVDQRRVRWRNRAHFYGVAAQLMRRILVDHARSQHAEKRGAGWERVELTDQILTTIPIHADVVALDEALQRLAAFDARQAYIVELRYFGGLTIDEAAEVLNLSPATVVREWTVAKAWLRSELKPQ
jgi:RNA polymerase sigma factor (TIGR02999 family)